LWSDILTRVTPADVSSAVVAAVTAARDAGELAGVPAGVPLTRVNGSYGTPLALRLAAAEGRPAVEVAELIAKRLAGTPGVAGVEVTGPGFLTIAVASHSALVEGIVAAAAAYGLASVPRPETTWPDRPRTFDNPGFRVRFAYARAAGVRRRADALGIAAGRHEPGDPCEIRLLDLLAEFPARTARRDPDMLKRHLERLADSYHDVYERCPAMPCGDAEPTGRHGGLRALAEAVRTTIGNGLTMLGETPRETL
jgi:arginyl-tRNA synthetase